MRNLGRKVFLGLAALTFAGCSGANGDGGSVNDSLARSREEALAKLTPEDKARFEAWQNRLVKACDATQIFGLNSNGRSFTNGIDGAILLAKNGNSLVFTEKDSLAVLTSYRAPEGDGSSQYEGTGSINGKKLSQIVVETKRVGSRCAVFLYGQKVYETAILESFEVGLESNPLKPVLPITGRPVVKPLGSGEMAEVRQLDLYAGLAQTLRPSSGALGVLARKLDITEEQADEFFHLSDWSSVDAAIRIGDEPSALWSNQENGNLMADLGVLKRIIEGSQTIVPLELRVALPQVSFGEQTNSADLGNLKLRVSLATGNQDAIFSFSTQKVESEGLAPFSRTEALACAESRATALAASGAPGAKVIQPSVSRMLGPCRTLYSEIEKASYESGLMKALLPRLFAGVVPSHAIQYNGWDDVVRRLAREAFDQDQNLRNELDPDSRTRLVAMIAEQLEALKLELKHAANAAAMKDAALLMSLNWSMAGVSVAPAKVHEIIQAIDRSIDPFQVSSESLLDELGRDPLSADDLLAFALAIDPTSKAEALKARALAWQLNYVDFEREIFSHAIQRKLTLEELRSWTANLTALKSEIGNDTNLGPVRGDLISLSMKWLRSGEVSTQELGSVYAALSNAFVPFETSTKDLVRALGQSLNANQAALDFARALTPEYKRLALAIREKSKAAGSESWGQVFFDTVLQKRPSLEQLRAWSEMWAAAPVITD